MMRESLVNVLLVEDEESHASLIQRVFDRAEPRLKIEHVTTLAAARVSIETHGERFILADLILPDGRSTDLLALAAQAHCPVVIMTSHGDEAAAVQAMKGGALDYVLKSPEAFAELPHTLARVAREWHNIEERKRAEAALRAKTGELARTNDHLRGVVALARDLTGCADAPAVRHKLLYEFGAQLRADGGALVEDAEVREFWGAAPLGVGGACPVGAAVIEPDGVLTLVLDEHSDSSAGLRLRFTPPGTRFNESDRAAADLVASLARASFLAHAARRDLEEQQRKQQYDERLRSIGQLAGGIAHDFNNLLSGMLGAAELIRISKPDPEVASCVQVIIQASERAADLTNKLLAFSRKGNVRRVPIDVSELVCSVRDVIACSFDRRIQIDVRIDDDLPRVMGDPNQLSNALLNLCINARDAMPEGGFLRLTARRMSEGEEPLIRITVGDTGCGIAPELLKRIFEPFYTTKPLGEGTGLGLPAVQGTVEEFGGQIQLESELEVGTKVHLHLPALDAEAPAAALPSPHAGREATAGGPEPADAAGSTAAGRRVLVVDDEDLVRKCTANLLRALGCVVHEVASGAAAEALLEHEPIDLLLLDMVMPGDDGATVFHQLRGRHPELPMVLISGYGSGQGRIQELLDAGAAGFLQKPFGLSTLSAALERVPTPRTAS